MTKKMPIRAIAAEMQQLEITDDTIIGHAIAIAEAIQTGQPIPAHEQQGVQLFAYVMAQEILKRRAEYLAVAANRRLDILVHTAIRSDIG